MKYIQILLTRDQYKQLMHLIDSTKSIFYLESVGQISLPTDANIMLISWNAEEVTITIPD